MAIALVGTSWNDAAGNTQLDITLAPGVSEGHLTLVSYGIAAQNDVDITNLSGYTEVSDLYRPETADSGGGVFWKLQGSTPDSVCSFQGNASDNIGHGAHVDIFSGVDQTNPIGNTNSATGTNSFVANPPSVDASAGAMVWTGGSSTSVGLNSLANSSGYTDYIEDRAIGSTFSALVWRQWKNGVAGGTEDPPALTLLGSDHGGRGWVATTVEILASAGSEPESPTIFPAAMLIGL